MKSIKELIPHFSLSNNQKQWKFRIMQEWESIMGNLVSKVSIHKVYNDSIVLGVSDSSWMQELYMLSNLIRKNINNVLDKPRIETIRFQYVAKRAKRSRATDVITEESVPQKNLTTREKKALERITDPELSQALTRLLNKCHQ